MTDEDAYARVDVCPDDTTTLMAMLPYLENDMDMLMNMAAQFSPMLMKSSMESSGIGI